MSLAKRGIEFLDKITIKAGYTNEWILIRDSDTSLEYGVYPFEREINDHINYGVLNLDKPPGPTSHEVLAWIKKMFNISRAGHGGTLEPRL
ncbi:MAG: tRNA pseudouridine synthase A [Desulfurococcaceae archaeon]